MKTISHFLLTLALLHLSTLSGLATSWVKFSGVDGDGDGTPEREGWSELKSYKDTVKSTDTGVEISDIKITKCADKASVALAVKMATKEAIPEVKLEFTRRNKDSGELEVYLIITYCNATITAIESELKKGDATSDGKLEETICLSAGEKKITDPTTGETTTLGGDP